MRAPSSRSGRPLETQKNVLSLWSLQYCWTDTPSWSIGLYASGTHPRRGHPCRLRGICRVDRRFYGWSCVHGRRPRRACLRARGRIQPCRHDTGREISAGHVGRPVREKRVSQRGRIRHSHRRRPGGDGSCRRGHSSIRVDRACCYPPFLPPPRRRPGTLAGRAGPPAPLPPPRRGRVPRDARTACNERVPVAAARRTWGQSGMPTPPCCSLSVRRKVLPEICRSKLRYVWIRNYCFPLLCNCVIKKSRALCLVE